MSFMILYKQFGEKSILIEWKHNIDETILNAILDFKFKIETFYDSKHITLNHAYNSILITYAKNDFNFKKEKGVLEQLYNSLLEINKPMRTLWKIPVCYNSNFGIDLEELSISKNMPTEEIIKKHSEKRYIVYFIGFLPGFLYLGGLDKLLVTPRRALPRSKIEKGSVAIGGSQTGIYPSISPAGWHVIGNTPVNFFESSKNPPCFAKAGDRLEFYPISLMDYKNIKTLVDAGVYQIINETLYD